MIYRIFYYKFMILIKISTIQGTLEIVVSILPWLNNQVLSVLKVLVAHWLKIADLLYWFCLHSDFKF